jgi:hypothetical protein
LSEDEPNNLYSKIKWNIFSRYFVEVKCASEKVSDDRGLLLFDADGDGDLDLYISAGGYRYKDGGKEYSDVLCTSMTERVILPPTQQRFLSILPANFAGGLVIMIRTEIWICLSLRG